MKPFVFPTEEPTVDVVAYPFLKTIVNQLEMVVGAHSPYARDMLFHSGNCDSNIDTEVFKLRAHDYSAEGDDNTWNFIWGDFAIQWYKHSGRCLVCTRKLSHAEFVQLLAEVRATLETLTFTQYSRRDSQGEELPLTPQDVQQRLLSLQLNGQYGAYGNAYPGSTPTLTSALKRAEDDGALPADVNPFLIDGDLNVLYPPRAIDYLISTPTSAEDPTPNLIMRLLKRRKELKQQR